MAERETALVLDCGDCAMSDTDACEDCVVTCLLDRPLGAIVFDVDEERALRSMSRAGLVPEIRYKRRTG